MSPPNVVFVVLDTVRSDRVGCYGYERETTPALDAFAAGATRFDDAVTQAPWSVPAHASLFTGKYPHQHGATTIRPILADGPTLPERLRAAGYGTYAVSPNEYVRPLTGFGRGFDEFHTPGSVTVPDRLAGALAPGINAVTSTPWLRRPVERLFNAARAAGRRAVTGQEGAADEWTVDRAASVLSAAPSPFFLFVNLLDVHLPPSPSPRHFDRFVDDDLRDVPVVADERSHTFREQPMSERGLRKLGQLYDAGVRTVDEQFERLLAALGRTGTLEDTLVVAVSDHGEHLGEFGLIGHQHSVFDSVVSVPLVVGFPGRSRGRVVDQQVETRRVFHTILDAAGVEAYPQLSLASGTADHAAYGEFFTPMLDIDRLVWDRTVTYDPDLLGRRLSFVRSDGHKLVRTHGTERLFRTPEREGTSIEIAEIHDHRTRLAAADPAHAVDPARAAD